MQAGPGVHQRGVAVRVPFQRGFAVRRLDFRVGRPGSDAKHAVRIHGCVAPRTARAASEKASTWLGAPAPEPEDRLWSSTLGTTRLSSKVQS